MTTPQQNAFRAAKVQGAREERQLIREKLKEVLAFREIEPEEIDVILTLTGIIEDIPPYSVDGD